VLIDPPRFSQVVRRRARVLVLGHHAISVPPEGEESQGNAGRDGLRLVVMPLTHGAPMPTIDITSSAAIAMLEGFLSSGAIEGKHISWESSGFGARRRDTIHIAPGGREHLK